jgi:Cyclic nucleotide-binding domain/FHA domain
MAQVKFDAGHVFYRPGDPSERAYLIESGQVEILTDDGRRLGTLKSGDIFGEMALVQESPQTFQARATAAGTAEALTAAEFEQSLLKEPARAKQYLIRLFEKIRVLAARASEEPEPEATESHTPPGLKLTPMTPRAKECLRESGWVLPKLPFRIGRVSDAKEMEALDLNDLWIIDEKPYQVSRNHLSIDQWEPGRYVVRDRGSFLGAVVNGKQIGGKSKSRMAELKAGENTLAVGSVDSPYMFTISVPAK